MTKVFKYPFNPADYFTLIMPQGAEILHVDVQQHQPCIWAKVDIDAPIVVRKFRMAGTGHELDEDVAEHIGTFFMSDGWLVFHLFEVEEPA